MPPKSFAALVQRLDLQAEGLFAHTHRLLYLATLPDQPTAEALHLIAVIDNYIAFAIDLLADLKAAR